MAKYKIDLQRIDYNRFALVKNKNFHFLLSNTYGFYRKILNDMESSSIYEEYSEIPEFTQLIEKLTDDNTESELSMDNLTTLMNWIDIICTVILELEGIDFNDKDLVKYFKIAKQFNKIIKSFIEENLNSSENIHLLNQKKI